MESKMSWLDVTALILVVVGALNWGLVGALNFNLVTAIFGADSIITTTVYILVGLAGLYTIWTTIKASQQSRRTTGGTRPRGV